jgi:hypothetical protein
MAGLEAESRELTASERFIVEAARQKAFMLYEGKRVPHRSCGIALAETFDLPTRPYQALRRGGITGEGYCGSIRAGELILGELLGDPDPAGGVTDTLRRAINWYQRQVPLRIDPQRSPDYICNNLTRQHGDFAGPVRMQFCTKLTSEIAALTAEALLRFAPDVVLSISPIEGAGA